MAASHPSLELMSILQKQSRLFELQNELETMERESFTARFIGVTIAVLAPLLGLIELDAIQDHFPIYMTGLLVLAVGLFGYGLHLKRISKFMRTVLFHHA